MTTRFLSGAPALLVVLAFLTACGSTAQEPDAQNATSTRKPGASVEITEKSTRAATPTPTPAQVVLPTDCRAILSEDVLELLDGVPLNDAAFGASGVRPDGSLTCIWADPRADTTGLATTVSTLSRGPALKMLNALAIDEGFTCYAPDEGTRCEKTWPNERYPVTDGRTVYWRDDVLIDTQYSNLAPVGYTASIVERIFG